MKERGANRAWSCRSTLSRRASITAELCATILHLVFLCGLSNAKTSAQELKFDASAINIPKAVEHTRRAPVSADLIELRDLHGIQISPDGKRIAFIVSQVDLRANSYSSALFLVRTDGTELINLGTAGPAHWDSIHQWLPDPPQWSADSKSIYYRYKESRGIWEVWRWNVTGGKPKEITHATNPVASFSLTPNRTALVLTVDTPDEASKTADEAGIFYDGTLTTWHGRPIAEERALASRHNEIWIHDLHGDSEYKASPEDLTRFGVVDTVPHLPTNGEILRKKMSPDGKYVAYQTYSDDLSRSRFSQYRIFVKAVNDDSGGIEISPADYRTLGEYWWGGDSRTLYYVERRNGQSPRLMLVGKDGKSRLQVLARTDFLDQFSFDNAGRYAAFSRQDSTVPAQVAIADLTTKAVSVLVDLNPELENLTLSPARLIEFSTKSGEQFHGRLVLPLHYQTNKRYPLIITGYSDIGDFLRGGTGDEYPIQLFAAEGFAVLNFSVSHNGLNIKSGDFDTAILRLQAPLEGMNAAIAYLDEQGIVDASKVGITGLSHGAEVLCYAISHSGLFRAAIASGPPGDDPYFFYMAGNTWQHVFASWGLGGWPEGSSSTNWHMISATLSADHIHTPLLLNAADSEYLVALGLVTSLEQLQRPIEMFVYPDELHIKIKPQHRREIYERNIDWFRFWLKDEEDPEPSKVQQYRRWHALRLKDEQERGPASGH
jgi:dipeptidyl aminopeptidase/acylaminoacyl peptidase